MNSLHMSRGHADAHAWKADHLFSLETFNLAFPMAYDKFDLEHHNDYAYGCFIIESICLNEFLTSKKMPAV